MQEIQPGPGISGPPNLGVKPKLASYKVTIFLAEQLLSRICDRIVFYKI